MDYLDPLKQREQKAMLFIGYFLIGIAVAMGTSILIQSAYGYGLNKNGAVIQSGLLFFSSRPNPAQIYANGKLQNVQTNSRLSLQAGIYDVQIKRDGYYPWQRKINLEGGRVAHFDYPLLVPTSLSTKKSESYDGQPLYSTQSPDKRWLIVAKPGNPDILQVNDLKPNTKVTSEISLPASLFSNAVTSQSFKVTEWSDDNQHILVEHLYDGKNEFAIIDRSNPDKSFNINQTINLSPAKLSLRDKKYDKYYFMLPTDNRLQAINIKDLVPEVVVDKVIAYKNYADNTLLYVTDDKAPANRVLVNLKIGDNTYKVRTLSANSDYLIDLATYSGKMYVAAGATKENKLYIYKDPVGQIKTNGKLALAPVQVLHVTTPNFLSFSDTAQFIMIENGQEFAVYDLENKAGHHYTASKPLDQPQQHAEWMDGHRLIYVSGSKIVIFDYDYSNQHLLVASDGKYVPAFSPDVKRLYALANNSAGQTELELTAMLAPKDQ